VAKRCDQSGFTLIELMVTITIAAILLLIAIPGFQAVSQRSQQTNVTNDLVALIGRARSEAVTRNKNIVICVSSDQSTCSVGSVTWESGWIMFSDNDNNSLRSGGEELLQVHPALAANVTLRSSGFGADHLSISKGTGLMLQKGTFKYCDTRGVAGMRALNLSLAGQVRVAVDGNGNGTVEDYSGAEIAACP